MTKTKAEAMILAKRERLFLFVVLSGRSIASDASMHAGHSQAVGHAFISVIREIFSRREVAIVHGSGHCAEMLPPDCRFKMASSNGDTFSDSMATDVLLNVLNGSNGRALLAGFSSTAVGSSFGPSAMRVTANSVTLQGSIAATHLIASGNVFSAGFSNVNGQTYASTLSNVGPLSVAGGDLRIDNNGSTTMFITQGNTTFSDGYWKFASFFVGPGGVNSGGLDLDGSFGMNNTDYSMRFNLAVSAASPLAAAYTPYSETIGSIVSGKVLLYLNTGLSPAALDVYIFSSASARASFTFRGIPGNFASFNPVASYGSAPTTSSTYQLVFDSAVNSTLAKTPSTLTLSNVQVTGGLSANGGLSVNGASVLDTGGNASFRNVSVSGNITTIGSTYSTGRSNIGNVSYFSSIVDAGAANIGGTLSATSNVVVTGGLAANSGVSVNGTTVIDAAGNGLFRTVNVAGNATIGSNLIVNGTLTVLNVEYVQSNVTIYSSETISSNVTIGGSLTTTGNTFATGRSNVGTVSYYSTIVDAGAATIGGTLSAQSNVVIAGGLAANAGLTVNGAQIVDAIGNGLFRNVSVGGNLMTTGNTFATGWSNVGTVSYYSTLVDAGAATIGGTLSALSNVVVGGGLAVNSGVTVNGAQIVDAVGNGTFRNMSVVGTLAATGNATIGGSLTTTGNTFATGRSNVGIVSYYSAIVDAGPATIGGTLTALANVVVTNGLSANGGMSVNGSTVVDSSGNGTFKNATVGGNLTVAGNTFAVGRSNMGTVSYYSSIVAAGPATIGGTLTAQANVVVTNGLAANGGISVNGTPIVDSIGNGTFGNLSVSGTLTYPGSGSAFGHFRNRIINGDMRIDQRCSGNSHTIGFTNYYVDRFSQAISSGSASLQQILIGGSAYPAMAALGQTFTNAIMAVVTTPIASPGTNEYMSISQHIEGLNLADLAWGTPSAAPVVLSFYVYSNITGTYSACLRGNGQCVVAPFTVAATGTWQRVVMTFPGNTVSGWVLDSTAGVALDISLLSGVNNSIAVSGVGAWQSGGYTGVAGGTNFMSAVNNTFYLTGVQLEKGAAVTPFEFRPFQMELLMCQRYYAQLRNPYASGYSTYGIAFVTSPYGTVRATVRLPTQMRANPVLMMNEGSTTVGGPGINLSGNKYNDSLYLYIGGVDYAVTGSVSISDIPVPYNSPNLIKLQFGNCQSGPSSYPTAGFAGELLSWSTGSKIVAFSAEI